MDEVTLLNTVKDENLNNTVESKVRILIVEYDKDINTLLKKVFFDYNENVQVFWASTFQSALEQIIQNTDISEVHPYQLIISDIILEEVGTGLDLYRIIYDLFPGVSILTISMLEKDKVNLALLRFKFKSFFYLHKPFSIVDCKNIIKFILNDKVLK